MPTKITGERERRRRRETADKAAEERQFETGLPHTFCLRDLNLVLIIIKIRPRYPGGDGVEGGLEVVTHIGELAPAVEVRPTSRRAVDLEPVLQWHRHRRAASESGWHRRALRHQRQRPPCPSPSLPPSRPPCASPPPPPPPWPPSPPTPPPTPPSSSPSMASENASTPASTTF